jgi:predicted TIM-barrel fold metal-dependent hydrolase
MAELESHEVWQGESVPVVAVTCDSHVGPRLRDQLREYCPSGHLADYDAYIGVVGSPIGADRLEGQSNPTKGVFNPTEGHNDPHARLRDMDRDGVSGEVVFHFSQNGEHFPFMASSAFFFTPTGTKGELEMAAVGQHIYNAWLADFLSVEPERHVGLAHLPLWNIDAAIRELEWAASAGLRGVNFFAPRPGIKEFDDPAWEPFWSACEDLGMVLTTHAGAGDPSSWTGRHGFLMLGMEAGGYPCRRGLHRMVFGGVFERHPRLKLVYTELTEHPSTWWPMMSPRYDELWQLYREQLGDQVPEPPSEYLRRNVFVGASTMHHARSETDRAVAEGYDDHLLWGSDYPHAEGTYCFPRREGDLPTTKLALRHTFSGLPERAVRRMAGENAVDVYNFDVSKLQEVAARIEAVTPKEIAVPPEKIPGAWRGGRYGM